MSSLKHASKVSLSLCLLLLFSLISEARTYYFSSSTGNDARSAAEAQSPATPWRSIAKLNTLWPLIMPGDEILFKRGDVFYGAIRVARSGTAAAPITFGAYGSGNKPVLTGFINLSGWRSIGGGRFEASHTALTQRTSMVAINGRPVEMGRYPNSNAPNAGYLEFESSGDRVVVDNELTASPSWTGAELVSRSARFVLDRRRITNHSGTRIYFDQNLSYPPGGGSGYFFQNHIRTLDREGEWFQNTATGRLTVFFGSSVPSGTVVQVATFDDVIDVWDRDHLVFEDLEITGSNNRSIDLYSVENVVVRNCNIYNAGVNGIVAAQSNRVRIENNHFTNANNFAVWLRLNCADNIVSNNLIENTGMIVGSSSSGANRSIAIREEGKRNKIHNNRIFNTGYIGIFFSGDYVDVRNNYIRDFNRVKDDGGGIYTVARNEPRHVGQKIIGNIVMNGIGAGEGTTNNVALSTSGIYIDDYAANIEISDNTVTNCTKGGILIHNAQNIKITNNKVYDNRMQLVLQHDIIATDQPLRGLEIHRNVFVSKLPSQVVLNVQTIQNDVHLMGKIDSNYYARPMDDQYVVRAMYVDGAGVRQNRVMTLEDWQQVFRMDRASKGSSATILTHRVNSLTGSNWFSNGDFHTSITGLNIMSSAAHWTRSWLPQKLDKGTFQGTFSDRNVRGYIVTVRLGAVRAGKNYVLRFDAKSETDSLMQLYLRSSGAPFTILTNAGLKTALKITSTATSYEYLLTPRVNEDNTVLFFEFLGTRNSVWLDRIRFHEADVQVTNPEDSIRLVVNPEPVAKTMSLPSNFIDIAGRKYSGSITLQPFGSAVLLRKEGGVAEEENKAPTVQILSPLANSVLASAQDLEFTSKASDADGKVVRVEYYHQGKLIGKSEVAPFRLKWNNVQPGGKYKVKAKAFDNKGKTVDSEEIAFSIKEKDDDDDDDDNSKVRLVRPTVNEEFRGPANVDVEADASKVKAKIARVEFYHGSRLVRTEVIAPYRWTWTDVNAGTYTLVAKAISDKGKVFESKKVSFTVKSNNRAPVVSITSPDNNGRLARNSRTWVRANATDADGKIRTVEFLVNGRVVHTERLVPFGYNWRNIPAGTHTLVARATDDDGAVTLSAPVTVHVGNNMALGSVAAAEDAQMMLPENGMATGDEPTLYPNPAVNSLFVGFGKYAAQMPDRGTMQIRNLGGALLRSTQVSLQGNGVAVDVSALAPGMYMITIEGAGVRIDKKFIKQSK